MSYLITRKMQAKAEELHGAPNYVAPMELDIIFLLCFYYYFAPTEL